MNILSSYPLGNVTSFKCGGRADFYVEPNEMCEFINLLNLHKNKKLFILGNGTNTLCPDEGYHGLVIKTTKLNKIEILEENDVFSLVKCECGTSLFNLNDFLANNSLSGFEFSYGIPATVGGALIMNSGAFGDCVGNFVESVEIFKNSEITTVYKNQISFDYRKSSLKDCVVLNATFKFNKGNKVDILKKQKFILDKRNKLQPLNYPSAGSIFLKENGISPSKIIDNLGLKGTKIGGAEISCKHAGFIINSGGATATDILNLISLIESEVLNKKGLKLKKELIVMQ